VNSDFQTTLWLTAQLATITTIVLIVIGLPFAYGLSRWKSPFKIIIESLVALPLVLPPTVLGFYLLLAFSPQSVLGKWLEAQFDLRLVFSFTGLVLGSVIYSFPFMIRPIQIGFERLPTHLWEASFILGKSHWTTFWKVLMPNIRPALLNAIVLSFAHTVGEFGVILMLGGNIPGKTRVASIAIYDKVEGLEYDAAGQYAFILLIFSFSMLLFFSWWSRKFTKNGLL